MLPSQINALVNREANRREIQLREAACQSISPATNPWYNDLSHLITDSTIFRLILIVIVVEWIFKNLG